jgi:hypothetical protein
MLAYAGLPWTRSAALWGPGRAVGAVLLAAGAAAVLRLGFARPPLPRLERVCVGLIMFSLGTVVLASLGRVDQSEEVLVPVRYSVLMTPLQVGLLGLLMRHASSIRSQHHVSLCLVGLACGLLLVAVQIPAAYLAVSASRNITATVRRFVAGERDGTMSHIVFPDLAMADQILARMRRHGLYCWLVDVQEPDLPGPTAATVGQSASACGRR